MDVMRVSLPLPPSAASVPRAALTALACTGLLAGCAPAPDTAPEQPSPVEGTTAGAEPAVTDSGLPAEALPNVTRDSVDVACPYLDNQFVAETNGQKITAFGTDERFDTPACVFWSYPQEPQLQVIVRQTDSDQAAREVVDWAAPVDITDPAESPAGWSGGRAGGGVVPGHDGAVYAVAKGPRAVVVFTNQAESVKAQLIAEAAITNLGL